jgi:predicted RNase H-like nuclease (RuvC/YqgF family)
MSVEMDALMREMKAVVERLESEVTRLERENARLGRENDEACDQIFELQQRLSGLREAAE